MPPVLTQTPHLFSKVIVCICIASGTLFSAWALRILSRTGHDPSALLGVALAFLGGELTLMCGKTIFSYKKQTHKEDPYD